MVRLYFMNNSKSDANKVIYQSQSRANAALGLLVSERSLQQPDLAMS